MRRLAKWLTILLSVITLSILLLYWLAPQVLLRSVFAIQAWQAGLSKHEIVVNDHRWVYYQGGNGSPLVLLHGFIGSKENWLPLAIKLHRGRTLVIPDLPGWGESQRLPNADYRVAAQAQRVGEFLAALKLQNVHLVGHSMGGHIAGLDAASHDPRISKLSLIASAGVLFKDNSFSRRVLAGETPFNFSTVDEFDHFTQLSFLKPPWLPTAFKQVIVNKNISSHAFHARLLAQIRADDQVALLEKKLHSIDVPTQVIWCKQDQVLDVSSTLAFSQKMPLAKITLLEDCGHMPIMESVSEVSDLLVN